jgi:hypothetical protein
MMISSAVDTRGTSFPSFFSLYILCDHYYVVVSFYSSHCLSNSRVRSINMIILIVCLAVGIASEVLLVFYMKL